MIAGAVSISMAEPAPSEMENWKAAMHRECDRYGLDTEKVAAVVAGDDPLADQQAPAPLVGGADYVAAVGSLCLAGRGHARAAHPRELPMDDCADGRHNHSAGPVRNAAVEKDAVFVRNEGVRLRPVLSHPFHKCRRKDGAPNRISSMGRVQKERAPGRAPRRCESMYSGFAPEL